MNIKHLSNTELKYGIDRCNARLAGVMPMGFMDKRRCQEALEQYKKELLNRGYVI